MAAIFTDLLSPVNEKYAYLVKDDFKPEQWGNKNVKYEKHDPVLFQLTLVACGIIFVLGQVLASINIVVGAGIMLCGACCTLKQVLDYRKASPLELAMTRIVGGKEKMKKVPTIKWTLAKQSSKKNNIEFSIDDVTKPIMRGVDSKGNTLFILFDRKDRVTSKDSGERRIHVYTIGLNESSEYCKYEKNRFVIFSDTIDGSEAAELYKLFSKIH